MDQLGFYVKLASKSLLRWLVLSGSGFLLSAIGIGVAIFLFGNNSTGLRWGVWTVLLLLASVGFIAIYIVVANKVSLGFMLFQLLENKLSPVIGDKVAVLVSSLIDRQPGFLNALKGPVLRAGMLDAANGDTTLNKVQRRVIRFGLEKVRLEDINFQEENMNLPAVISGRVLSELEAAAQPGYRLFWLVAGAHALLLVLALVFDYFQA